MPVPHALCEQVSDILIILYRSRFLNQVLFENWGEANSNSVKKWVVYAALLHKY